MNIEKVMEINDVYGEKIREEDHTNELHMDIWLISDQVLHWYVLVGTQADLDTFGEYTRRFERSIGELKRLMESI